MLGQIVFDKGKASKMERSMIGDVVVLTAYVPEGKSMVSALAARRAAKQLESHRVRLAAFPAGYAYRKTFFKRGILPSNETALRWGCAEQIVLCLLRQLGKRSDEASIAIIAEKQSTELERAVTCLALHVRYLTLDVPKGEKLAEQLRLRYGIALRPCGTPCDLAILWDRGNDTFSCPTLSLTDETIEIDYCPREDSKLPRPISRKLLAALVQEQPDYARQIAVQSVRWT